MKKLLEDFFGLPFEKLLETRSNFTLQESVSLQPELDVRAMAYFNLAKLDYSENEEGYKETFRDEVKYLSGSWLE